MESTHLLAVVKVVGTQNLSAEGLQPHSLCIQKTKDQTCQSTRVPLRRGQRLPSPLGERLFAVYSTKLQHKQSPCRAGLLSDCREKKRWSRRNIIAQTRISTTWNLSHCSLLPVLLLLPTIFYGFIRGRLFFCLGVMELTFASAQGRIKKSSVWERKSLCFSL